MRVLSAARDDRTPTLGDIAGRCARCGGALDVRIETDGDGRLVDVVEPCETCVPRIIVRAVRRRRNATAEQRAEVGRLIGAGMTVSGAARKVGVSVSTASRYARATRAPGALCGCGRPAGHPGRCSARRNGNGNGSHS